MIRTTAIFFLAATVTLWHASSGFAQEPDQKNPADAFTQVMVLGTYHFGNPGHDLHNMTAESVLTPAKQKELAMVAAELARFKPNKVAVEAVSDHADLRDERYEKFTPRALIEDADETIQIGYRVAQQAGLKTVYAIDERSQQVDYFPYGKVEQYAKAHGKEALLKDLGAQVEAKVRQMELDQRRMTIGQMLARLNEPAQIAADHNHFYYALLRIGDQKEQPGADLNGAWYLRNAKIFAKLTTVTQPGDHVLVLFGAGHAFWLRHFVQSTSGFALVDAHLQ